MPRNAEVIRQWNILREIEGAHAGVSTPQLAALCDVSPRTIRRDLNALQEAGFPLYDEREGNSVRWFLNTKPFRALADTGFTLSELCALYFSRAMVECLAGTPFEREIRKAFDKLQTVLSPRMRAFLDRLPQAVATKPEQPKRRARRHADIVGQLLEATLREHAVSMRYHSFSSNRTKQYEVHPYRLVYAQGGLYLFAYVPEYGQIRTFAVERIQRLALLERAFEKLTELEADAFPHSLGVNRGDPEPVSIEFSPRIARYVRERTWHPSQRLREQSDGSVVLDLNVCHDWALRSWIHSFGPFVRVLSPSALAEQILDDLEEARTQYAPRMEFELPASLFDESLQVRLPLGRI